MTTAPRVTHMRSFFLPGASTCVTLCTSPSRPTSHATAVPATCLTFPALFLPRPPQTLIIKSTPTGLFVPTKTTPPSQASRENRHSLAASPAPGLHLARSSAPPVRTCFTLGTYPLPSHPYTSQAALTSTQLLHVQHLAVATT